MSSFGYGLRVTFMLDASPRVLVFDSGLGGLTVAREIRALIPQAELTYYADNAFFPYGTKSEQALLQRVLDEVLYLERSYRPAVIVIACNTASTLALPQLRARTRTPIVGVVPAVKPAAESSSSRVIGLLATPGTVLRQYTSELIAQFAGHCQVVSVGSAELVELAEAKMRGSAPDHGRIETILAPFHQHPQGAEIDTMVLACTHFPLLAAELQAGFGRPIRWLDSGQAIARRVRFLLSSRFDPSLPPLPGRHRMLCSAELPEAAELQRQLWQLGFTAPQTVARFAQT
jgi:glutamate racemase